MSKIFGGLLLCAAVQCLSFGDVSAQIVQNGTTVSFTPPAASASSARIDFANAKPMPMPMAARAPSLSAIPATKPYPGPPMLIPGGMGSGQQSPVQIAPAKSEAAMRSELAPQGLATPQEYGAGNVPYTTSRVNAYNQPTSTFQPYAATGKLYFKINGAGYLCSASLIKPGILVTAAHCVANYGTNSFYSDWVWVPGYNYGSAPYGQWSAKSVRVMTSYLNGTDGCYQAGVICPNDVAVINLLTPNGLPGSVVGWYGIGVNGYSHNASHQALINQLGYPVALDGGEFMQRTDSQGTVNATFSNNIVWGSLQTGGSSGGPLLVNFGRPPVLSNGISFGADSSHNVVVGVTSWGYVDTTQKLQGASPFTSNNITVLVNQECANNPGKC